MSEPEANNDGENDESASSSDDDNEESEFSGTWDEHCRAIAKDMQVRKIMADDLAAESIKHLLAKNKSYIVASAPSEKTLLHWAAYGGCPATLKLLLSRGADREARDIWERTAYDIAVSTGQREDVLKSLRKKN